MTSASDTEPKATLPTNEGAERDTSFYFDDDPMVIFLVENKLFKVHRHYFIKGSQIFRDMFSTANINQEGETDEKPIQLPDVTRNEFQTLLKFFYALPSRVLGTGPMVLPGVIELTLENKLSLLSISHRFLFDDIFHFVVQQVKSSSIPMVERIRLGDKYDIREWLSSAYIALLDRSPGDLSGDEARALGSDRVACLYSAKCFMYQERVEEAGEVATDDKSSKPLPSRTQTQQANIFGQHSSSNIFGQPSGSNNPSIFAFPQPSSTPVKSGKALTPTSEVVKKFFKLK